MAIHTELPIYKHAYGMLRLSLVGLRNMPRDFKHSLGTRMNHAEREWQGPYPLHDLASVLLARGADALAVTERLPDELPAHHPLMDARQSARQLLLALGVLASDKTKGGA